MIPTTSDLPDWVTDLSRRVREHEAQEGKLYAELSAGFTRAVPTKREAVSQFVAASHAFASVVLQSPADYPASALDYATGLLNEALAYVQADRAAQWG